MKMCVVTGGAGFIGSHVVDALVSRGSDVVVIDNFCEGKTANLNPRATLFSADLMNADLEDAFAGADAVFHFAADPFVGKSAEAPEASFEQNVVGTFRVLEACRKQDVKQVVFASTSTVYGESPIIPTPETAPLEPISNYGASKLACEAYCSSYAHSYGIKATVLRYANIFGPRSRHGVMWDFYWKLGKNPRELPILGNGLQSKSYLLVSDAVSATFLAARKQKKPFDVFNVGSKDAFTVREVAAVLCRKLGAKPRLTFSGGKRGWVGDVPKMLLDSKKLERLGWKRKAAFQQGVDKYVEWMKNQPAR